MACNQLSLQVGQTPCGADLSVAVCAKMVEILAGHRSEQLEWIAVPEDEREPMVEERLLALTAPHADAEEPQKCGESLLEALTETPAPDADAEEPQEPQKCGESL